MVCPVPLTVGEPGQDTLAPPCAFVVCPVPLTVGEPGQDTLAPRELAALPFEDSNPPRSRPRARRAPPLDPPERAQGHDRQHHRGCREEERRRGAAGDVAEQPRQWLHRRHPEVERGVEESEGCRE